MGAYKLIVDKSSDACPAKSGGGDKGKGGGDGDNPIRDLEFGKFGPDPAKPNADSPARRRLLSLDVFRGITVALMILVDDAGAFIPSINHSPWDGVTLADFVMPFFLFIVGVSLALAYKRVPNKVLATKKAVLRALKLVVLGLVLQGGFFHGLRNLTYGVDISSIRVMGVLQRIAIAYLVAAICEIWLRGDGDVDCGHALLRRYRFQLLVGLIITMTYTVLLYGLYVPDWEYEISVAGSDPRSFSVRCGVRGDTGPGCNVVGMVDRKILGLQHLYKRPVYQRTKQCSINSPQNGPLPSDAPSWCQAPFDPEGLLRLLSVHLPFITVADALNSTDNISNQSDRIMIGVCSSVMAIVTCLIGLQFGHVIVHIKDHRERIFQWMIPSFCLLAMAFSLDFFGLHMNKPLYSISYTCITAGAAGLLFVGIYFLVDVYGYRRPTFALEWMGVHALMIYVLIACNILPFFIQGFYWGEPRNNLLTLIGIGA